MTKYSFNLQKEVLSEIMFQYAIFPWHCTIIEKPDTGIDMNVQPYDETSRSGENDLYPFPRRLLVQLKSTFDEPIPNGKCGKLQIDREHLIRWKQEKDPVLIVRYYFREEKFYYAWIDEIDIKEEQGSQVIQLPYVVENIKNDLFGEINQREFKEHIISKLARPNMTIFTFDPDIDASPTGIIEYENVRNKFQFEEVKQHLFNHALPRTRFEQVNHFFLQKLLNGDDSLSVIIGLVWSYIKLGKKEEAIKYLNISNKKNPKIESKILLSYLKDNIENDIIIDNLDYSLFLKFDIPLALESKICFSSGIYKYEIESNLENIYPISNFGDAIKDLAIIYKPRIEVLEDGSRIEEVDSCYLKNVVRVYRGLKINNVLLDKYNFEIGSVSLGKGSFI